MNKRNWVLLVAGVVMIGVAGGVAAQNVGVDFIFHEKLNVENGEVVEPEAEKQKLAAEVDGKEAVGEEKASEAKPLSTDEEVKEDTEISSASGTETEEVTLNEADKSATETIEGVFSGQADSHTVELEVDGDYRAFKLKDYGDCDEVSFSDIEVGEKVKVECRTSDDGHRTVITAVEVLQ